MFNLVLLAAATAAVSNCVGSAAPECLPASDFEPIASLAQEDAYDLRGMQYNASFPFVPAAGQFASYRIGFLVAHCFEEVELAVPYEFFRQGGARVDILAPWWIKDGKVASCEYVRARAFVQRTLNFTAALGVKFDALVVPGGIWSSTVVRNDADAITLLRAQAKQRRLIATVCSGSTVLIDAKLLARSSAVTGSPAVRVDLENAGFDYKDVPIVQSASKFFTGRSPEGQDNQLFTLGISQLLLSPSPSED